MKNNPLNYEEARQYIETMGAGRAKMELGLEQIRNLLSKLQQPQNQLKYIHVAGTNGKGSIGAFLASILAEAGYRVGRFVSPATFNYREQIQVIEKKEGQEWTAVEWIAEDSIVHHVTKISSAIDEMIQEQKALPSPFEVETTMAFLEFVRRQCDIVILEVGMGGRLDATNIIEHAECTVLASISMDHMEFLGNTLTEIAKEKAGIIKPAVPVVSDIQEIEAVAVIEEIAEKLASKLTFIQKAAISNVCFGERKTDFSYRNIPYAISLLGENQVDNALVAIECIEVLREKGYQISAEAVWEGLRKAEWKGRFHRIKEHPVLIADGAHNEGAARSLRASIERYYKGRTIFYIMGMLADKECEKVLEITAECAAEIYTIAPPNPRALSSADLAKKAEKYCENVFDVENIETAIKKVFERAGSNDVIIAFGSLSFLSDLYDCFM